MVSQRALLRPDRALTVLALEVGSTSRRVRTSSHTVSLCVNLAGRANLTKVVLVQCTLLCLLLGQLLELAPIAFECGIKLRVLLAQRGELSLCIVLLELARFELVLGVLHLALDVGQEQVLIQ